MATARRLRSRGWVAQGLLALVVTGAPVAAACAPPGGIARLAVVRPNDLPAAGGGRYLVDTGGGFILDRRGSAALLKFDGRREVWLLSTVRGPRGDVFFQNDVGQPLLRLTRLGGVTVFTRQRPLGAAARFVGPASTALASYPPPGALPDALVVAGSEASQAARRPVSFRAADVEPAAVAAIADAAVVTSEAIGDLAVSPGGPAILARLSQVELVRGRAAAASFHSGVISIAVAPQAGLTGRPSSARILQALGAGPSASPSP